MGHPAAQRLRGHVDDLDLVGGPDHRVRHPFPLRHPSDLLDYVVERLQVLDVDRRDDVNPRCQEQLYVLPPLLVSRPGHVGVRELVDQGHRGPAGQHRVEVHLGEAGPAVGDLAARNHLHTLEQLGGVLPAVGLRQPDDDVGATRGPAAPLLEHRVGLPNAGCGAQVDPKLAATHGPCPLPVFAASLVVSVHSVGDFCWPGRVSRVRLHPAPG